MAHPKTEGGCQSIVLERVGVVEILAIDAQGKTPVGKTL
jgi:hypothetical protein